MEKSFVPFLKGKRGDMKRPLYFHYPNKLGGKRHGTTGAPQSAIIEGDWKLIYYYESQTSALFNLKDDLSELHNLIIGSAMRENRCQLAKDLTSSFEENNAIIPVLKSTGRPVRYPEWNRDKKRFLN